MKVLTILSSFIFILVVILPAFAGNKFEPRVGVSESYNDNIYLDQDAEKGDWKTTISPGINVFLENKKIKLDLDYSLSFQYYQKYSDLNETDLRDVQRGIVDAQIFPDDDFTLGFHGTASRVVLDQRDLAVEENDFFNRSNLYQFTVNPEYRWRTLKTFTVVMGYEYDRKDYVSSEGDDSSANRFTLSLFKKFINGVEARLVTSQEIYAAETTSDYDLFQVRGGLDYPLSPHWALDAEAGQAQIDLETQPSTQDVVWLVELDGRLARPLTLTLSSSRSYSPSATLGLSRITQHSVTIVYEEGGGTLEARAFVNEDRFEALDRTDKSVGGSLKGNIPLARRLSLIARADSARYKFLPGTEETVRTGGGISLEYTHRRGLVALGHTYRQSNSNIDSNDFDNNIFNLTVTLRF